jgi:hypothetical protein
MASIKLIKYSSVILLGVLPETKQKFIKSFVHEITEHAIHIYLHTRIMSIKTSEWPWVSIFDMLLMETEKRMIFIRVLKSLIYTATKARKR